MIDQSLFEAVIYAGSTRIGAGLIVKGLPAVSTGPNAGLLQVGLATSASDKIVGVTTVDGLDVSGQSQDIASNHRHQVLTGAAIDYGDRLTTDANGKAVVATAGQNSFGISRGYAVGADRRIDFIFAHSKA
jgi:hypothetical protein